MPYFGKNNIHYDKFEWHIYTTDHFEIYYYPEIEQHLERVAGYAESAYQQISADLKHDLAVQGAADPVQDAQRVRAAERRARRRAGRRRRVRRADPRPDGDADRRAAGPALRPDRPRADAQFEFDIIPQSLIRRNVPLWVNEGLSDYERGNWTPIDLMTVRDAAVADIVPKMSELEGLRQLQQPAPDLQPRTRGVRVHRGEVGQGRHPAVPVLAAQERHRRRRGRLRRSLRMKTDEFDQAFERYLKERFKPFRDKERPADYGRDLAPNPREDALRRSVCRSRRRPPAI